MSPKEPQSDCIKVERKVSYAFLLTLLVYVFVSGGWTGTIQSQVADNKADIAKLEHLSESMARVETNVEWLVKRESERK